MFTKVGDMRPQKEQNYECFHCKGRSKEGKKYGQNIYSNGTLSENNAHKHNAILILAIIFLPLCVSPRFDVYFIIM